MIVYSVHHVLYCVLVYSVHKCNSIYCNSVTGYRADFSEYLPALHSKRRAAMLLLPIPCECCMRVCMCVCVYVCIYYASLSEYFWFQKTHRTLMWYTHIHNIRQTHHKSSVCSVCVYVHIHVCGYVWLYRFFLSGCFWFRSDTQ